MSKRNCPFCGHKDNGDIRAVLNEIRDKRLYVARCHCPGCDQIWDEHFDKSTGETRSFTVSGESVNAWKNRTDW